MFTSLPLSQESTQTLLLTLYSQLCSNSSGVSVQCAEVSLAFLSHFSQPTQLPYSKHTALQPYANSVHLRSTDLSLNPGLNPTSGILPAILLD